MKMAVRIFILSVSTFRRNRCIHILHPPVLLNLGVGGPSEVPIGFCGATRRHVLEDFIVPTMKTSNLTKIIGPNRSSAEVETESHNLPTRSSYLL
jgi:hypothetical protein